MKEHKNQRRNKKKNF